MTTVEAIDNICEWFRKNVAENMFFKKAPGDRQPTGGDYRYELVNPAVFPMYVPYKEELPAGITSQVPFICVSPAKGIDTGDNERRINLRVDLGIWNPGEHAEDVIDPGESAESTAGFTRSQDGWRDLWNFLDNTTAEIESVVAMNGVGIMKDVPVEYEPYYGDAGYFYARILFSVTMKTFRVNQAYEALL